MAAIGPARSFVAVALCAQLAHGVLYQSVLPRAGSHGYFNWYLPALTVAVVAGLVALPASIAAGAGRRSFSSLLPGRRTGRARCAVVRLAFASGVYVLVQESLERSAELGGVQVASFGLLAWLTLALALVVAAAAVVGLERTIADLVVSLTRTPLPRAEATTWVPVEDVVRRRRPLTVHGALRAPPLTV